MKIQMVLDICLCETAFICMWVNALWASFGTRKESCRTWGTWCPAGALGVWSEALQIKPLLALHSFPSLALGWDTHATEHQSLTDKRNFLSAYSIYGTALCVRIQKENYEIPFKETKKLFSCIYFPWPSVAWTLPCLQTHSEVNNGNGNLGG